MTSPIIHHEFIKGDHVLSEEGLMPPTLEWIAIDAVTPSARNARTHSKKQIRQIADSISAFGFLVPLLIDEGGVVIAGHGRYAAAKLLGLKQVPVIEVKGLSEAKRRALALADNKIAENAGRWPPSCPSSRRSWSRIASTSLLPALRRSRSTKSRRASRTTPPIRLTPSTARRAGTIAGSDPFPRPQPIVQARAVSADVPRLRSRLPADRLRIALPTHDTSRRADP
jgi:ParB-like nuclease domain